MASSASQSPQVVLHDETSKPLKLNTATPMFDKTAQTLRPGVAIGDDGLRDASPASQRLPSPRRTGSSQSNLGRTSTISSFTRPAERRRQQQKGDAERTDARWAAMQATLAEVEQSAMHNTHFFSTDQLNALDELRNAQMSLAQAWARSEIDSEEVGDQAGTSEHSSQQGAGAAASAEGSAEKFVPLEGTDDVVLLARKRREANDKYFQRISNGVGEVVGKLDKVAEAMGKVERESREIWSDSESEGSDEAP